MSQKKPLLWIDGSQGVLETAPGQPALWPVWCNGRLHAIYISSSGRIRLHNHPEGSETLKVMQAHGVVIPCLTEAKDLVKALQEGRRYYGVPLLWVEQKRTDRAIHRIAVREATEVLPLIERLRKRLKQRVSSLLKDLAARWCLRLDIIIGEPNIACKLTGRNGLTLMLWLPWRWSQLDRAGIAMVDGVLILDLVDGADPLRWRVLAMKQGKGRNLYSVNAELRRESRTAPWHLTWIR